MVLGISEAVSCPGFLTCALWVRRRPAVTRFCCCLLSSPPNQSPGYMPKLLFAITNPAIHCCTNQIGVILDIAHRKWKRHAVNFFLIFGIYAVNNRQWISRMQMTVRRSMDGYPMYKIFAERIIRWIKFICNDKGWHRMNILTLTIRIRITLTIPSFSGITVGWLVLNTDNGCDGLLTSF